MQRTITTTALSCLSLLSLQGYAVPQQQPDIIKTNEQLRNLTENTILEMLQPNHDTPEAKQLIAAIQQVVYNTHGSWFNNVQAPYTTVQKTICIETAQKLALMARAFIATKRVVGPDGQQTVETEIKDDLNYKLNEAIRTNAPLSGILKSYAPGKNLQDRARSIIIENL